MIIFVYFHLCDHVHFMLQKLIALQSIIVSNASQYIEREWQVQTLPKKKLVFFCHFFLSYELHLMVCSVLYVILHVMQLQPQI